MQKLPSRILCAHIWATFFIIHVDALELYSAYSTSVDGFNGALLILQEVTFWAECLQQCCDEYSNLFLEVRQVPQELHQSD